MTDRTCPETGFPTPGPETAKAIENFGTGIRECCADSGRTVLGPAVPGTEHAVLESIPRSVIQACAEVKLAALEALEEHHGYFSKKHGARVIASIRKVGRALIRGDHDVSFPLPFAQGGAGTSLHMNMNEVMASLVYEDSGIRIDPIEDLARFQSTNDILSSAASILAFRISEDAENDAVALQEKLVSLELKYDRALMCGRTELQDALPMRVGSLYGAWAGGVERDRWRLSKVSERVREIPLGGTALGSGFGAPAGYTHAAERHLRRITGLPLSRSQNMMDSIALKDTLAEVAGALKLAALNLVKMAADLLYLSSSAVAEFSLPDLQYGSSMMPLKTNPVRLERCRGLALSAAAEADKTALFVREGQLQLNAYLPFILRALVRCAGECRIAFWDLHQALEDCRPDTERMEKHLASSPAILNALLPLAGYRKLKRLRDAVSEGQPENLADLAVLVSRECGLDVQEVLQALEPGPLTGPAREHRPPERSGVESRAIGPERKES